ncbi:MAG TPA: hypothetical protein VM536_15895, partial [Chloroflexia bacterium]|nr:hypothetical protein [Chloroflexia bacterium]
MPLLAVLAYGTALRVGFLSDDFVLLSQSRFWATDLRTWLPFQDYFFYRPVATVLTWVVGYFAWDANPLPYHILGLLLHAGVALLLGLWLAEATGRPQLGQLAGAIFAVYPLHMEAVGWLAAQFDLWATLFAVGSLFLFTAWWRRGGVRRYGVAVLLYMLALLSKESVMTFPVLFAAAAWLATPRLDRTAVRRLGLALVPFAVVLAGSVGLRYAIWGRLGNYPWLRTDYPNFLWDSLFADLRILLVPLNKTILPLFAAQTLGVLVVAGLLTALVLVGYPARRALLIAAVWLLTT